MTVIKELNKWRVISCSWIRKLNIVKMSVSTNLTYRVNTILIIIPASHYMDIDKLILKVYREAKDPEESIQY